MDPSNTSSGLALAQQMQTRRPWSAWSMSVCMHAGLLVLLAVSWRLVPKGAKIESDRNVGIVLVHQQQGQREYSDVDADHQDAQQAAASIANAMPNATELAADLTTALPGAEPLTAGGMAESILDATQLTGDGRPRQGGTRDGTSTEVFGVTGQGTKFVYVFDRSGSMANYSNRPLRAVKMELHESLRDLQDIHQFQIIFYNERPRIFELIPGRAQLVWANAEGKRAATGFIETIRASGGTEHLSALKLALGMHPDVVFFLTDADDALTYDELQRIQRWNSGSTIHAIEFGSGPPLPGENFLVRMARQNGGQHAYVDVLKLRDDPR